jgi:hypothetical protein
MPPLSVLVLGGWKFLPVCRQAFGILSFRLFIRHPASGKPA